MFVNTYEKYEYKFNKLIQNLKNYATRYLSYYKESSDKYYYQLVLSHQFPISAIFILAIY